MTGPIGPTIIRECGYCEGQGEVHDEDGRRPCTNPLCNGSGRVPVEVHPFVTLEALVEHIQAVRVSFRLRRVDGFKPPIGSPAYHLDAAEDYASSLFQQLVVMLPEEHERTEGE